MCKNKPNCFFYPFVWFHAKVKPMRMLMPIPLMLFLLLANGFAYRCPKFTDDNKDIIGPTDVCVCLTKQLKIACRLHNYDLHSFDLIPEYFGLIRDLYNYDQLYFSGFHFVFCLNTMSRQMIGKPIIQIESEMFRDVTFDEMSIVYCDHSHMNPIEISIGDNFLSKHSDTLTKLQIEIPYTSDRSVSILLQNLAHSVISQRKLKTLVFWMAENLYIHLPPYWFGQYRLDNVHVPLSEINFIDYHLRGDR